MSAREIRSYVMLIRHAKREVRWDQPEEDHQMLNWKEPTSFSVTGQSDFEENGMPRTFALAGVLCDQLAQRQVAIKRIFTSDHAVARQTAQIYRIVLEKRMEQSIECGELSSLTPEASDSTKVVEEVERIEQECANEDRMPVIVLVGHQPHLTQVAGRLLEPRKLPARVLPLGSSEVACIERGEDPRLPWLITEKSKILGEELEKKIQSKFDVAKFLLGALVLNFGLYLQSELWSVTAPVERALLATAMFAALLSFSFTIATLLSYDRLLMPTAFWSGGGAREHRARRWTVLRPPSQSQLILFYEMTHIWKRFFIPAVSRASIAIGLLVVLLACKNLGECLRPWLAVLALTVVASALAIPMLIYNRHKPNLGFDD